MILQIYMQRSCTILDLLIGAALSLSNYTANTDNDDHLPAVLFHSHLRQNYIVQSDTHHLVI